MHPNAELIDRFYTAFAAGDADTMVSCYGPNPTFRDPAFGQLRGPQVGAMWRMLLGRATDLEVTHRGVFADDRTGGAHWTARYTFEGKPIVNEIEARFTFTGGRIATHVDNFDMWKWTRQALGPVGIVAGWTPVIQGQVQRKARDRLEKFMAAR